MEKGEVIHLVRQGDGDKYPTTVDSLDMKVGEGIVGNRGTSDHREITIIEESAILALREELGVEFSLSDSRRNVVTRGIELNFLVDKEFFLGGARLKGTALCHPCSTLEEKTHPGVKDTLKMRGGLCAKVIEEGSVKIGSTLRIPE